MTDLHLVPFLFEGDSLIRVEDRNGDPWFVATDVCRTLGIRNAAQAVLPLDEDEKGICSIDTPGGVQELLVVSEGGLYTLILRSRLATTPGEPAHRFRRWVTSELLPTIRKTGKYDPRRRPDSVMDEMLLPIPEKRHIVNMFTRIGGPRAGAEKALQLGFKSVPALDAILAQKQFSFVVDLDESGPSEPAAVN